MSLANYRKVPGGGGTTTCPNCGHQWTRFVVSEGSTCQGTLSHEAIEERMLENLASEDLPKELDPDQAETEDTEDK